MKASAERMARVVAAVTLLAAGGLFLWLTFFPSGLGQIFGDDEFEPLSGVLFLVVSAVGSIGLVTWSRLRWLGIAITVLGIIFWVPFVLNTTPTGPSPAFVVLYAITAVALAFGLWLEPKRTG